MFVVKEGSTSTQHSCAPLLVQTVRLVLFCGHSLSHSIKMFPFSYRTFMGSIYSNKGGRCSNCSQNFVSPRKRSQEESYERTSLVSFTWMTEFDSSSKFIMRPSTANTHSRYLGVPTSAHPSCAQRREKCDQLKRFSAAGGGTNTSHRCHFQRQQGRKCCYREPPSLLTTSCKQACQHSLHSAICTRMAASAHRFPMMPMQRERAAWSTCLAEA